MTIPLSLLTLHFVGDFLLQSDWTALNKSKRWDALFVHCLIYSLCFVLFGWLFVLITFILHVLVDAVTSRITSKLWFFKEVDGEVWGHKEHVYEPIPEKRHWFFVVIGTDQLLHFTALAWTLHLLTP